LPRRHRRDKLIIVVLTAGIKAVSSRSSGGARLLVVALLLPGPSCLPGVWPLPASPLPPNLHVIEEGQAYRSDQPIADQLANIIDLYGIRTVVNLRGSNPGELWYDAEVEACEIMGVTLVDHAMSAGSLPSAELLGAITNTLLTAEYPVLIHCQMGADRTGAISAIYRMLVLGHERADALSELSPAYFHFRALYPCMDTLAELYEPGPEWLAEYAETVDDLVCTP